MTLGNKKRCKKIAADFAGMAKENPSSDTCIYRLITTMHDLITLFTDFYMRPEANDENVEDK